MRLHTDSGGRLVPALGASGGGCVLVVSRADKVDAVAKAVASLGELVPFRIDEHGVERCA
jgi:galactokinase